MVALGVRSKEGRETKEDCAERVFATNLDLKSGSTSELSCCLRLEVLSVGDGSSVDTFSGSCGALCGPDMPSESTAERVSELLPKLSLDLSTGPSFSSISITSAEVRGDVVFGATLDDWEDCRRIATGLLLFAGVFTWKAARFRPVLFEFLGFSLTVSSLLALWTVEDVSASSGRKVSLSASRARGLDRTLDAPTTEDGSERGANLWVLEGGVPVGVLSSPSSSVMIL